MPRKLLFIAEGVALAHVARALVLAQAAHDAGYDVTFATDARHRGLLDRAPFKAVRIDSMDPARFLARVRRGSPVFTRRMLERYVADDVDLIADVRPDMVIGDLRLSLSVSARLAHVPYAAVANGFWSPYWRDAAYPAPPTPLSDRLPRAVSDAVFGAVRPLAFAWHAVPLNRTRRKFGLAPIPYDVRNVYTDGDYTLYADVPQFYPLAGAPLTHRFLGPVIWSPPVAMPQGWDALGRERPLVYVALGSSGDPRSLGGLLDTLGGMPIDVVAATLGAALPARLPANVHTADFAPGDKVARAAALVICNGGASTAHQALAAGTPLLALATNLDHFLNMAPVDKAGAGMLLEAARTTMTRVRAAVETLLARPEYGSAARGIAKLFAQYPARERFVAFLSEALG